MSPPAGLAQGLNFPYRLLVRFGWKTTALVDFSRGIVRDIPRHELPAGGVYDAVDFLLDKPGVARKRGGTSYQGTTVGATTTGVSCVIAPEYPTGVRIGGVGADGHLWDITSTSSDIGALATTVDKPKLFVDKVFYPFADGTTAPKKLTSSGSAFVIANWGGSPPAGKYCAIHLSRPVIGGSAANPNRLVFGPVPDPESTWDTTNAYVDTNHQLSGIAPVQGVLCCFSSGVTERLVGSVPPGTDGEDMALQTIGQVGCADARSISTWGSFLVFASQDGIYATNGSTFDSLIEKTDASGILSFWRDTLYPAVVSGSASIAAGILNRNYYILSAVGSGGWIDSWICYLPRKTWSRLANIKGLSFADASVGADELYMATSSGAPGNKVLKLSGILQPASGNKNDADGTAVAPTLTTGGIGAGIEEKVYGFGHLRYDMRDAASDNPTMAVTLATGIEATSYAAVTESPLVETTDSTRKRFTINKDSDSISLKFTQTNASSKTEIYTVEVEERGLIPREEF